MKKTLFVLFLSLFAFTTPLMKGEEKNSVIVTDNGLEMLSWQLAFIAQANHSIDLSSCYFGGEICQEIFAAIEARLSACPDLKVYILTTPIMLEKKDFAYIEKLEKLYPNNFTLVHASYVLTITPDLAAHDNHIKMLVVDEHYFTAGGTNLDIRLCSEGTYTPEHPPKEGPMGPHMPAGARDQDVVGRGPIAKYLREEFYKHFSVWVDYNKKMNKLEINPNTFKDNPYYSPILDKPFVDTFETSDQLIDLDDGDIKAFFGGPHQKKNNKISKEYLRLIKNAKEEICIANLYFSPYDPIFDALIDAVNRGVKLTLITNGTGDIRPSYTDFFAWANRISYVPVLYGKKYNIWDALACSKKPVKKTKIYEYHVKDMIIHKKMMIVDKKTLVVGSYNLGVKSHYSDYELILAFYNPDVAVAAYKVWEKDLAHSKQVTPKEAREWYFNPITSYKGAVQRKFHGLL
ncbi:MAG: putative cardiolipin synthase YwiE [Chlamydiae bacterium]|nr:putative cardiolipin synthase YwiE [Chlamydiota bacterium]